MAQNGPDYKDRTDFANENKGRLIPLDDLVIFSSKEGDHHREVWNNPDYNFLNGKRDEKLANRSLWRQSKLCNITGFFEVVEGIYQVRGADLST
jgi:alkyl sulfatase BDS1-like metallo-beta-lactamase superfamily hydrolase